jgi:hypothetical protein
MESVTIATSGDYDAIIESRLERLGRVSTTPGRGFLVEDGPARVYVSRNDFAKDELEPEELTRVMSAVENPCFYSIDFSDIRLCRRVLEAIADDPRLLVDNDHGVVLSGTEFVHLLRSRPAWDWRTDPP